MYNMIGSLGSGVLGLIGSAINTKQINEANKQIARETNAANREMVEMQNKAAAAESEKAYQRSKSSTQVSNMMQAGMSRAGAINALNGGGSYTPAPVNTSQDSAPQMQTTDLSAFANIGQAFAQRAQQKHDEKMQAKQLAAQKEEAQKQRDHELLLKDIDTANLTQGQYINYGMHKERLDFDKQQFNENIPKIKAEIANIVQNTNNLKKVGQGIALDNIRKELENQNYPTLAKLANTQAWQNIEYTAMKLAHENAEHMNAQEKQALELEFYRSIMDSGINLTNAQNELQAYLANKELNLYKDGVVGDFIGALTFSMNNLVPKFALFK